MESSFVSTNEDHKKTIKNYFIYKKYNNINLAYITVSLFVLLSILIWTISSDLGLNLFSEAIGTAFTVIIIDNLLYRSDRIKWKIVKDDVDYLISRNINKLRENILSRLFDFDPDATDENIDADSMEKNIRQQRDMKLDSLSKLTPTELFDNLERKFSNKENILYFDEKAAEIRQYLDMVHSEYLSPNVVHSLIDLYVNIKDLCAHMKIYNKGNTLLRKNKYYIEISTEGISFNVKNIIITLIKLKKHGYSEPAKRE